MDIVKCLCQHCNRFTVVPQETLAAAGVRGLVEALEPFSQLAEFMVDDWGWSSDFTPMNERLVDWVGPSDLRIARTALERYRGKTNG